MKDSVIAMLSMNFAIRTVRFYKFLTEEKRVFIISKQLLRSGTSIGANVSEAVFAQSRADFISKMSIALKEAGETRYWIELLYKSEIIEHKVYESLLCDIKQIIGTLVKIVSNSKDAKSDEMAASKQ
ncbi:MAG: four helix bundle protein [Prevotella sp.]|nr:four helix bundle protein [Prevotella sp.]